jgi:hypothetical protein
MPLFTKSEKQGLWALAAKGSEEENCIEYVHFTLQPDHTTLPMSSPKSPGPPKGSVGCTNRIKRLSVGINNWILTEDLSINK